MRIVCKTHGIALVEAMVVGVKTRFAKKEAVSKTTKFEYKKSSMAYMFLSELETLESSMANIMASQQPNMVESTKTTTQIEMCKKALSNCDIASISTTKEIL